MARNTMVHKKGGKAPKTGRSAHGRLVGVGRIGKSSPKRGSFEGRGGDVQSRFPSPRKGGRGR